MTERFDFKEDLTNDHDLSMRKAILVSDEPDQLVRQEIPCTYENIREHLPSREERTDGRFVILI